MDPSTPALTWLLAKAGAVKLGVAMAGFIGATLSLVFLRGLTRSQMFASVSVGFFSSLYCTPLALHYLKLTGKGSELGYGIAFILGLMAMNLIPLAKALIKKRVGEA